MVATSYAAPLRAAATEEGRALRKMIPVTRRARWTHAPDEVELREWRSTETMAPLDDLREAVTTLESVAKSWTRVYRGSASRDAEGPERAGNRTRQARPRPPLPSPSRRRELSFSVFRKPTPWRRTVWGVVRQPRPSTQSVTLLPSAPRCEATKAHACPQLRDRCSRT